MPTQPSGVQGPAGAEGTEPTPPVDEAATEKLQPATGKKAQQQKAAMHHSAPAAFTPTKTPNAKAMLEKLKEEIISKGEAQQAR
jgi:peroxiredoxin